MSASCVLFVPAQTFFGFHGIVVLKRQMVKRLGSLFFSGTAMDVLNTGGRVASYSRQVSWRLRALQSAQKIDLLRR